MLSSFIRRLVHRRHIAPSIAALILLTTFAYIWRTGYNVRDKSNSLANSYFMTRNASFVQRYNLGEDAALQKYITQRKHKIKAVILILVRADRLKELHLSIELLSRNFNQRYGYPVVIFHEADLLPFVESVRQFGAKESYASATFFQLVDLTVPEWYKMKFGEPSASSSWFVFDKGCSLAGVGYRSMCRFQAKLVYEQAILRHFDYYWRLDDDSKIITSIPYDVFDVLKAGGFSYGFYMTYIDECAHKTYPVAKDYAESRNITPTFFYKLKPDEIFSNNFEVSSFKLWRSRQYRDFIEHIDFLGGIYKHRWGDAPIKTLALSIFTPMREIYRFRNFTYLHSIREIREDLVTTESFLAGR